MRSHLFLLLWCYWFLFWTVAKGRLFPRWKYVGGIQSLVSDSAQSNFLGDSHAPGSQEKDSNPGEVWQSPRHQGKFGVGLWCPTRSTQDRDWQVLSEKVVIHNSAQKTRHLCLALGWPLLWKKSPPPQILSAYATPLVAGLLIPPLKGKWMRMAVPLAGQDLDLPNSLRVPQHLCWSIECSASLIRLRVN